MCSVLLRPSSELPQHAFCCILQGKGNPARFVQIYGPGKTSLLGERKLQIHAVKGVVRERCEKLWILLLLTIICMKTEEKDTMASFLCKYGLG